MIVPVVLTGVAVALGASYLAKKKAASPGSERAQAIFQVARDSSSSDPVYYEDSVRSLVRMGRPDLARELIVHVSAPPRSIPRERLETALSAGVAASQPSAPSSDESMPLSLKEQMAAVLRALGVNPETGQITGRPTADAVSAATLLAAQFESQGYYEAASVLRHYAREAARIVESSSPPAIPPSAADAVPPDLAARVSRALRMESDPRRLRALAQELRTLPNASSPVVQIMIAELEQKAAAAETQIVVAETTQQIDQVLQGAAPSASPPASPAPPVAAAKTPAQVSAEAMCRHLSELQARHGMPGAKGKEDKSLVSAFQALAGQTSDGKAGPGTLVEAARAGVCDLPLVMYWPKSATARQVNIYRDALRAMGRARGGDCLARLEASATRERGQAGIVGAPPA